MKVNISKDYEYPVYGLGKRDAGGIEVPDELYERYIANLAQYDSIQQEIAELYDRSVIERGSES